MTTENDNHPDTPQNKEPDAPPPAASNVVAFAKQDAPENAAPPPPAEPAINLPPAVKYLCLLLAGVFLLTHFRSDEAFWQVMLNFGFIPARYTGDLPFFWQGITGIVTHAFLHGGWMHLCVNIGMLMAFGTGVEQVLGARRMIALFVLSSAAGALLHFAFYPHSANPLIGASGGISGLFGAVLMMMYYQGMLGGRGYRKLMPFVLVWVGISLFFGFFGVPGTGNAVAWAAHVGGFAAGIFLFRPLLRHAQAPRGND